MVSPTKSNSQFGISSPQESMKDKLIHQISKAKMTPGSR